MKLPDGSVLVRHKIFPEFDRVAKNMIAPPDCRIYRNQELHPTQFVDNRTLFRSTVGKRRKKAINWNNIRACYNVRVKESQMCGAEPKLLYKVDVSATGCAALPALPGASALFSKNIFDKCTITGYTIPSHTLLNIATRGSTIVFKNCTFKKNVFIHSDVKYRCIKCTGSLIPYNYAMFKAALKTVGRLNEAEDIGDFTAYRVLKDVYGSEIRKTIKASESVYFFLTDMLQQLAAGRCTIRQRLVVCNKEIKQLRLLHGKSMAVNSLQATGDAIVARAVVTGPSKLEPVALRTGLLGNDSDLVADIIYCGHIGTKMILSDGILFVPAGIEPVMRRYRTTEIVIQNSVVSIGGLHVMLMGLQELKPTITLKHCICIDSEHSAATPNPHIVRFDCKELDLAELLEYGSSYSAKLLLAIHRNCPYMQNTITDLLNMDKAQGDAAPVCVVWPEITFPFTKKKGKNEQRID